MSHRLVWLIAGLGAGIMLDPHPSLAEERVPSAEEAAAIGGPTASDASAELEGGAPRSLVSMDFQDAELQDVLKMFSKQTGLNVIAGPEVTARTITLYLEDVETLDALDQILAAANLTYERPLGSEIYIVKEQSAAPPKTITRVYRLKYARVSESLLAKVATTFGDRTPYEAVLTAGGAGGSSGTGTSASTGAGAGDGGGGGTQGKGIDTVLSELLTDRGEIVVDGRTNSVIVTDVPDNFPRLEAALAALDVRTPQIMVDAELIETTLGKAKDLGLEWGTGTAGEAASFTPGSGGRKTRFPFGFVGHSDAPTVPTAFPLSTLSFESFKGILEALEKDTDTRILAHPKVLTLDNESALIRLSSNEAVGFDVTTSTQSSSTQSKPERTTTGVVLVVTPQINSDGYITMMVEPSVTKTVVSTLTPPTGQTTPKDPKTRSTRAVVRIRSGDTLMMGGLIDRSEEEVRRRVPILAALPIIGGAFRHTEIDKSASELVVFITPHILKEPAQTQVAAGPAPFAMREQEGLGSRQELIEKTLNRLEE